MPSRAHLMVQGCDEVQAGDVLAKIPRETTKTKDITGGLPRVVGTFRDPQTQGSCRHQRNRRSSSAMESIAKGMPQSFTSKRRWQDHQGILHPPRRAHQRSGRRFTSRPVRPSSMARSNLHDLLASSARSSRNRTWSMPFRRLPPPGRQHQTTSTSRTISRQMMRWSKVEDVGDTTSSSRSRWTRFRFARKRSR